MGVRLRWLSVAVLVMTALAQARSGGALSPPYARTLADLCPGTPDPCVVTGKFAVADGTSFNASGHAFELSSSAALVTDNGASFSILNATAVTLDDRSQITAVAKGVNAGAITIQSTGLCTLNGKVRADVAVSGGIGGQGGTISVTCGGITFGNASVTEATGAGIHTTAGVSPGPGGSITLSAGSGPVNMTKGAKLSVQGKGATGGSVAISSTAACNLAAGISADAKVVNVPMDLPVGGDGGSITVQCGGPIDLSKGAMLLAGSVKTANFGLITLTSSASSVQVDQGAAVVSDGGDSSSSATTALAITAHTACTIDGKVRSNSKLVSGGTLRVTCAGLTMGKMGVIDGQTGGEEAANIAIDTTGATTGVPAAPCDIAGKVTAKASAATDPTVGLTPGIGGFIDLNCGTMLTIEKGGTIDASGAGGDGQGFDSDAGLITAESSGTIDFVGKLTVKGRGSGGTTIIEGCDVTVDAQGLVQADGADGGENDLTAHGMLTINGKLSAQPDGINSLVYRGGLTIPDPTHIKPAATQMQNLMLTACP